MPTSARIDPLELTAPVCVILRFRLRLPNGVLLFALFDDIDDLLPPPERKREAMLAPTEPEMVIDAFNEERERRCEVGDS